MKASGPQGVDHTLVEELLGAINAVGRETTFLKRCLLALAGVVVAVVVLCLV